MTGSIGIWADTDHLGVQSEKPGERDEATTEEGEVRTGAGVDVDLSLELSLDTGGRVEQDEDANHDRVHPDGQRGEDGDPVPAAKANPVDCGDGEHDGDAGEKENPIRRFEAGHRRLLGAVDGDDRLVGDEPGKRHRRGDTGRTEHGERVGCRHPVEVVSHGAGLAHGGVSRCWCPSW